ncbi:SMI1/KNR4 family protein [Halalkalibacter sp. AB-rgal2]|uniref:SMI1/KNR4 family protein n=1 Tax=Halalkalibacter sp. AB-rgal2 TaxID=3242695 RepID=UPI00359EFDAE
MDIYDGVHFWSRRSVYKPGSQLNETTIQKVEQQLGYSLPQSYINLMKKQNGGDLVYRYFVFEDGEAIIVPYLFELDEESGVGMSRIFLEQCDLPEELVLLTGDLDAWIALDYRQEEPTIVYLIQDENGIWEQIELAQSFSKFINRLMKK